MADGDVDAADRARYEQAGLFDPDTDLGTGRLDLLAWLEELGFSVDDMVHAQEVSGLAALPADRRLLGAELVPVADAAAEIGVDAESLEDLMRTLGFTRMQNWSAGTDGITVDGARAMAPFIALGEFFTPDEARSLTRVIGSAMARVADAAVSLFLSDVESVSIATGESDLVFARRVFDAVALLDGMPDALDPILRRHVAQAIDRTRQSTISDTERFEFLYAVGFVDLVGFTEVAGQMDPHELSGFLRRFEDRAYDVVTSAGGRVVKLIGDEVMFVASDPADACRAGAALMDGFGAEYAHVVPRGGLAYGPVLVRGGDYYGSVVNLASRLVDEAVPQELLVTAETADAASPLEFEPAGRRMVKGFADPVTVRSLTR